MREMRISKEERFAGKQNSAEEMGNRIAKHISHLNGMLEKSTYYLLDAQGNQISMYEHLVNSSSVDYTLVERNIYGSSLLGVNKLGVNLFTGEPTTTQNLGLKYYHISNHLGNVLTVFSDLKTPITNNGQTVSGYEVTSIQTNDYSPFGAELDGRTTSGTYRYLYQGSEMDKEIKGDGNSYTTTFRQLDPRLGRWFSIDPKASSMPWQSPYCSMDNNPILFNDILGDSIRVDKSITGNSHYKKIYDTWASTKEGKSFIKEYGEGGQYEHIAVEFKLDQLDDTWGDTQGQTTTLVVDKKSKIGVQLPGSSLDNAQDLAKGKDKTSYLKFVVALDIDQYVKGDFNKAIAVNTSEHETQHVDLILQSLLKNGKRPTAYQQHQEMSKGKLQTDRINTFKEIKSLWKNDYESKWKDKRSENGYIIDKINNYAW